MTTVSVFMDVEDPINPLANDAAIDFGKLFTEAAILGSFCITGEKCRALIEEGRTDVIEAIKPHTVGLHTNTHSFHPTTMELLSDLSFEEGCQAAYDAEKPGVDAFQKAFGRLPCVWGGAGNTWSPEITDALKRLNIPAYVYALTRVPDHAVHRLNGVIAMTQALSISETDWSDDARANAESDRLLRSLSEIKQPWVGIFIGHPTKFRHTDYWDKAFWGGRTPPALPLADPLPRQNYTQSLENVRRFLNTLRSEFKVVGVDEAVAMPWTFRPAVEEELAYFNAHTPEAIRSATRWPVHKPDLDNGLIIHKTLALAHTLEIGSIVA
ncbi:MAG: hypothetical protein KF784_05830 [Fimbriimonadaceae bacterium]|nr:hypothetical protein [Fimbriimonadaceae bacterium]